MVGPAAAPAVVTLSFVLMWYGLNVAFNLLNKTIFNYFPFPYTVSAVHVVVGLAYCVLTYLLGAKKASFGRARPAALPRGRAPKHAYLHAERLRVLGGVQSQGRAARWSRWYINVAAGRALRGVGAHEHRQWVLAGGSECMRSCMQSRHRKSTCGSEVSEPQLKMCCCGGRACQQEAFSFQVMCF